MYIAFQQKFGITNYYVAIYFGLIFYKYLVEYVINILNHLHDIYV